MDKFVDFLSLRGGGPQHKPKPIVHQRFAISMLSSILSSLSFLYNNTPHPKLKVDLFYLYNNKTQSRGAAAIQFLQDKTERDQEMADLFHKQAKSYAESRPGCPAELFQFIASKAPYHQVAWDAKSYADARHGYPADLFQFIASKTPNHQLAWDAGTGTGQAAISLAGIYENVVATDASEEQIAFATKLPNIRYQHTPPTMSIAEVERDVAAQGSVDIVTVAQAFHWFDQPAFYQQAKWVLRKPGGVLAVWCSTLPRVNKSMDHLLDRFFVEIGPLWETPVKMVFEEYRGLEFPFEAVEGTDHTGPFEFEEKKMMSLDAYLTYIRSWSAYQTAKDQGIELLSEKVVDEFRSAWGEESDQTQKLVRFPIFLRIGKVGQEEKN